MGRREDVRTFCARSQAGRRSWTCNKVDACYRMVARRPDTELLAVILQLKAWRTIATMSAVLHHSLHVLGMHVVKSLEPQHIAKARESIRSVVNTFFLCNLCRRTMANSLDNRPSSIIHAPMPMCINILSKVLCKALCAQTVAEQMMTMMTMMMMMAMMICQ